MKPKISLGAEFQAEFVGLIEGGWSITKASKQLGTSIGSVLPKMKADASFAACVRAAELKRGPLPKYGRPSPPTDLGVLFARLQGGASIADACRAAGCDRSWLARHRRADPELDRKVTSLMTHGFRFDGPAKATFLKFIGDGLTIAEASRRAGVHPETGYRHLQTDPVLNAAVRAALDEQDDTGILRPTPAKAKFRRVLALLQFHDTVRGACKEAGVEEGSLYHLLRSCPERRAEFDAVVSSLDSPLRGKRAARGGAVTADFDKVVEELRAGACMTEACNRAGVTIQVVRRRRRDPAYDRAILATGYQPTPIGRRLLKDRAAQQAVLDKLSYGAPLEGLGICGLPSQSTVRSFALENIEFAAELAQAISAGQRARAKTLEGRLSAAIEAIASGIKPHHLGRHNLLQPGTLNKWAARHPDFQARLDEAKRIARGDQTDDLPLSVEDLVDRVTARLPRHLRSDERQCCLNQAWIDANEGTLRPSNISIMARRYAAQFGGEGGQSALYVDSAGDLRSTGWD